VAGLIIKFITILIIIVWIWEPLFNIQYRYAPLAHVASRPCGSLSRLGPPEAPAHQAFARPPGAPVGPWVNNQKMTKRYILQGWS
jgi:hypothetical protein